MRKDLLQYGEFQEFKNGKCRQREGDVSSRKLSKNQETGKIKPNCPEDSRQHWPMATGKGEG